MADISVSHGTLIAMGVATFFTWVMSGTLLDVVTLVPAYALPPTTYFWTLLTSAVVESSVWWLIFNVAAMHLLGHGVVEPAWKATTWGYSYRTYLIAITLATNAVLVLGSILGYASGHQHYLAQRFSGFIPNTVAVAVLAARLVPVASNPDAFTLQLAPVAHWVVLAVAVVTALLFPAEGSAGGGEVDLTLGHPKPRGSHLAQVLVSFALTWLFARAYTPSASALLGGDTNNASQSSMLISVMAESNAPAASVRPLPGSTASDADRRRQLALAALNERLKNVDDGDDIAGAFDGLASDAKTN
eukprot:PhM_4_TR4781/c0_g1_i1/m.82350